MQPSFPKNPTYNKSKDGTGSPNQSDVPLVTCVEVFGHHKCKVHDVRNAKDDGNHSPYNCNTERNQLDNQLIVFSACSNWFRKKQSTI